MPRQPRIEYEGAIYHVMARGDRREAIVQDDKDREMFIKTLGEACQRTGWSVYAWILMDNHYHLVIQTPGANLVAGMKWFQNTYTRRLNTRHKLWGHVFGGRYKAILVEEDEAYLTALIDYVHLNPARAGMVDFEKAKGLLQYRWSSLARGYGLEPKRRDSWLKVKEGLKIFGFRDTTYDRKQFAKHLEERGRAESKRAGKKLPEGQSLQSTMQRGWYWGSQEFRERLLKLLDKKESGNRNYRSSLMMQQSDRQEAEALLEDGFKHFGLNNGARTAVGWKRAHSERVAIAFALHRRTSQPLAWVAQHLDLKSAANASQQVRRLALKQQNPKELRLLPKPMKSWLSRNVD